MLYKKLSDQNDPKELRYHEDRVRKRLLKFGYSLSKGKVTDPFGKIPLKRRPVERGYQIVNLTTGAVELGEQHDLTLAQVQEFWETKSNEWWAEKMKAKRVKAQEERYKMKAKRVETFSSAW